MSKTPKLRFKEFSGDWESNKLSNYTEKITRKNKDFLVTNVISNSARNGLVSQRDFFDKDIANQNNIDGYYIIENGDFVYNPRKSLESPYGPINRYNIEDAGVVSPLYLCFKINEKVNGKFLEYYFKSSKWYRFIYQNSDQGARHDRVSIKDSEFFKLNTKFPSLEEQEKISSFFSLIDDKISLQGEKVEALKDYKKGMMQKIFSRELRFKDDDGRDYPEWEEKKLGDCIDTITDYVAAGSFATIRENVQYKNNKDYAQLIRTVDLKNKFKNNDNFIYVDKNAFEFLYRVNLDEESIILPNVGNIGEVYFVNPESLPNEKNVLAPNSILLRSYKNDNAFLYQLFNTKKFRDSLDIITSKSGQPKFNKTELKEIKLNIPIRQEQVKIAKFLENIDFKIEKEQEKLNSLNQYKKGLLQQMFV